LLQLTSPNIPNLENQTQCKVKKFLFCKLNLIGYTILVGNHCDQGFDPLDQQSN
jgi:hypothetical protein